MNSASTEPRTIDARDLSAASQPIRRHRLSPLDNFMPQLNNAPRTLALTDQSELLASDDDKQSWHRVGTL